MRAVVMSFLVFAAYPAPSYGANTALRCVAPPESVEGTYKRAAAVFVGEVIEVKDVGALKRARFRVEQSWKGVETDEVAILATRTAESPHYHVGGRYLVFAGLQNGRLFTGNCSRTKRVEKAQEDLRQLGPGQKPGA